MKRGYDHEQPREGNEPSRGRRALAFVGGVAVAAGFLAYGCAVDEDEHTSGRASAETKCYSPDTLDVSLIVRPIRQDEGVVAEATILIDENQSDKQYNSTVKLIESLPGQEFCVRALAATQSYTVYYGLATGRSNERTNLAVALDENETKPLLEDVRDLSDLPPGSQYVNLVVPKREFLEDGSYTQLGE